MQIKRKKIYYRPGLISLIGIPLLVYFFIPSPSYKVVMRFFLPKDDMTGRLPYLFTTGGILQELQTKKINTVQFDGDEGTLAKKLFFIQQEARKLKYYHDTTQVIKVHLPDETRYGTFVELVKIMFYDGHKRYVLIDNDFYIYGEKPPEPPSSIPEIQPIYL